MNGNGFGGLTEEDVLVLGGLGLGALALFALSHGGSKTAVPGTVPVGTPTPGGGVAGGNCPAGQVFNGITGQCQVPFPETQCPVNYVLANNGGANYCAPVTNIQSQSPQQLCAQIGYQYNASSQNCVAPAGYAGETLAPGGTPCATYCAGIGYQYNAGSGVCISPDGSNSFECQGTLPTQTLAATTPVPCLCATGYFWDQQNFPGQPPIGCIADPNYPSGAGVGICPAGMSLAAGNCCQ